MSKNRGSIRAGVYFGLALSIAAIGLLAWISSSWRTSTGLWTYENPAFGALLFIGVVQGLWILPSALVLLVARRMEALKGLLLVAGSVFLLNFVLLLPLFVQWMRFGRIAL